MENWQDEEARGLDSETTCECITKGRVTCDHCEDCNKEGRRQLLVIFAAAEEAVIKEKIMKKLSANKKYDKVVDILLEANYENDEEKANQILEKARKILEEK